jgi:hypothetical protein
MRPAWHSGLRELGRLPRRALDWLCRGRADYAEFRQRRRSIRYRRRLGWCRNLWIGAALLMLLAGDLRLILFLAAVATLLSFALLDERG